ncbi:hypothetical protein DSO57_1024449 [Entomophthora muscae]|uniref:Uncharacterized protein n=1 Tax=Entomophthora muscae TaxID=34485 RepID=A0ACC2RH72_9FUNG|nr:hypothetical protein DSO57_1024449 [Entomophthora muscae]
MLVSCGKPSLPPEPFALSAILSPFKDAFEATLSCALPPHSCHNLTFKTTVDLVKIDAPMYPLSKLENKVLGAWLDNMLAKGWIVKKASLVSSLWFLLRNWMGPLAVR